MPNFIFYYIYHCSEEGSVLGNSYSLSRLTRPKMRDFESAKIGIIKDVRGLLIETERLVQIGGNTEEQVWCPAPA